MKYLRTLFTAIFLIAAVNVGYSLPTYFYGNIAIDGTGQLIPNSSHDIEVSIYNGGTLVYQEVHSGVNVDAFSAFVVEVGTGTPQGGFTLADFTALTANVNLKTQVRVYVGGTWISLGAKYTTTIINQSITGFSGDPSEIELPNGNIIIGNIDDEGEAHAVSGDATLSNTGVLTIANDAVTSAKILDGSIAPADVDLTAEGWDFTTLAQGGSPVLTEATTFASGVGSDATVTGTYDALMVTESDPIWTAAEPNYANLTEDETVTGNWTFNNLITGSISGNAGTVTNGLYTTTAFAGDVSGLYNNLQLGAGVVGSAEIADGTIAPVDVNLTAAGWDFTTLAQGGNPVLTTATTFVSDPGSDATVSGTYNTLFVTESDPIWVAAEPNYANLTQDETVTGNWTFDNIITGDITGNAGTVTNGLYTTTAFAGDVSGLYNNLQLGAGVVGTTEIADGSIVPADVNLTAAGWDFTTLAQGGNPVLTTATTFVSDPGSDATVSGTYNTLFVTESDPIWVDAQTTTATTITPAWTFTAPIVGSITGNAETATALATARNFSISGDATAGPISFDGTADVTLATTIANSAVTSAKILDGTIVPADVDLTAAGWDFDALAQGGDAVLTEATNFASDPGSDATVSGTYNALFVTESDPLWVDAQTTTATTITPEWTFTAPIVGSITGNAETATALATARNFSISGDATAGPISFNGTADVTLATTIANSAVTSAKILDGTIAPADVDLTAAGWDFTTLAQGGNPVLTEATTFLGDVSGLYNNLQLGTGVVGATELASTTVSAGNYGNATTVPTFTVDADGRLTAASNVAIAFPAETDPEVAMTTATAVPVWNGTALVDGSMTDDGATVDVGGTIQFDVTLGDINTTGDVYGADANFTGDVAAATFTGGSFSGTTGTFTGNVTAPTFIQNGSAVVDLSTGLLGDVTGTFWATVVGDDSHNHTDGTVANNLTIDGGTINNTPIGATTPGTGAFTTLTGTTITQGTNAVLDVATVFNEVGTSDATVSGTYGALDLQLGTGVVDANELASTTVLANTYGDGTNVAQFTVDEDGRLTAAANVAIAFPAEVDGIVGNEVTDAANTTLTRSGTGTAADPYKLALNLGNANTWTATQTFAGIDATSIGATTPGTGAFTTVTATNDVIAADKVEGLYLSTTNYLTNGVRIGENSTLSSGWLKFKEASFDVIEMGETGDAGYYGIAVNEPGGAFRAGIGWDETNNYWAVGVGDGTDVVGLTFTTNSTANESRIGIINNGVGVFGVDAEGDVAANSVTAPTFTGALVGNASTATALQNARNFSVSGDATTASAVSFNGTADVDLAINLGADVVGATELASTAVAAGTYGDGTNVAQFTVDADGRLTAAANVAIAFPAETDPVYTAASANIVFDGDAAGGDLTGTYPNPTVVDNSHDHNATTITTDIVSSVEGVTNDGGNIDVVGAGITVVTSDDLANTITITSTEVDGSITNEVNTSAAWDNLTNTFSVTDPNGNVSATITGFLEAETDPVWVAAEPNYANLTTAETITGDWVNTANPWADNEVADNLTIDGGTINNTPIGATTPSTGAFTTLTGTTITQGTNAVLDVATIFAGDVSGLYDDLQLGADVVGPTELASTAVTAGTYGAAGTFPTFTVDADGRLTAAGTQAETDPVYTAASANIVFDGDVAGGDLTGTYPNPSVADDSHSHTATTLPTDIVYDADLAAWTGSTNITTLGTITTGTWNGTAIADAYVADNLTISGGTISASSITAADNAFTLQDETDATKQAQFQLSGITADTTRTYTLPDADGTVALTSDLTLQKAYEGGDVATNLTGGDFIIDASNGQRFRILNNSSLNDLMFIDPNGKSTFNNVLGATGNDFVSFANLNTAFNGAVVNIAANVAAPNAAALKVSAGSSSGNYAVYIENDGEGWPLAVVNNSGTGNGQGLYIDNTGSVNPALEIADDGGSVKLSYEALPVDGPTDAATISPAVSVVYITSDNDGNADVITMPAGINGEFLYVVYVSGSNGDDAVFGPTATPIYTTTGDAQLTFVYAGGAWKLISFVE